MMPLKELIPRKRSFCDDNHRHARRTCRNDFHAASSFGPPEDKAQESILGNFTDASKGIPKKFR